MLLCFILIEHHAALGLDILSLGLVDPAWLLINMFELPGAYRPIASRA